MKTANQQNNPQQQPQQSNTQQQTQGTTMNTTSPNQTTTPTTQPTQIDWKQLGDKFLQELSNMSLTEILNSPVIVALVNNPMFSAQVQSCVTEHLAKPTQTPPPATPALITLASIINGKTVTGNVTVLDKGFVKITLPKNASTVTGFDIDDVTTWKLVGIDVEDVIKKSNGDLSKILIEIA